MSTATRSKRRTAGLLAALAALALVASSAAAAVADHLLLSELVVQTRTSPSITGAKYIELVNPTAAAIDLAHVFLTNATYNSPPTYYYDIVKLGGAGGGGTAGRFHARFPDGAAIAAGDTVVVAVLGSADYQAAYGHLPDYELYEDGLVPDAVPDLVPIFPGSIGRGLADSGTNTPDLASGGQSLVLYRWDGQTDLVQDLDYALWGTVTAVRVDKTDKTVDGPDADTTPSAYLPDVDIGTQRAISGTAHTYGNSYQRLSADEGAEVATGGNGLTGHNEMGELLNTTWRATQLATPPATPASFTHPAPVITAAALSPVAPEAGQAVTVTATVLAFDAVSSVTLAWSDDGATWHDVACTNTSGNAWSGQIPAQAAGVTVSWYVRAAATGGGQATRPVAAPIYTQSYVVAAPPEYPPLLLMTQVCTLPSPAEFIEIANPTGAAVDLSNYYLTDAMYSSSNEYYWRIVEGNPSVATIGGGAFTDFHARFPAGARIAAGDTITIAIAGSDAFMTQYGIAPDYELYEDSSGPDDVPDMREVFAGSIMTAGQIPSLSNAGEIVMLYYWNGQTDLVTDIDMFQWGTGGSYQFAKTGVTEDGPDADTVRSAYKADTPTSAQSLFPTQLAVGDAYHRLDGNEGAERKSGGNGTLGHDETSENLSVTWGMSAASPALPGGGQTGTTSGTIALNVPARTFLPLQGESFPIRFRSLRGSQTELRIYNLAGRLVVTLYDSRYDGGFATAEGQWTLRSWNGRDSQFELMPAGLYVAHLSAVNPRTGDEQTKTAPVVLATRLSK